MSGSSTACLAWLSKALAMNNKTPALDFICVAMSCCQGMLKAQYPSTAAARLCDAAGDPKHLRIIAQRCIASCSEVGFSMLAGELPGVERYVAYPRVAAHQSCILTPKDGASIADRRLHKDAVCPLQQLLPASKAVLDLFLQCRLHASMTQLRNMHSLHYACSFNAGEAKRSNI